MVITEGTGEITVEGKITKVGPGTMMYCAAGKLHGIVNTGRPRYCFTFINGSPECVAGSSICKLPRRRRPRPRRRRNRR